MLQAPRKENLILGVPGMGEGDVTLSIVTSIKARYLLDEEVKASLGEIIGSGLVPDNFLTMRC